jgi:hypothetical protein
MLSRISINNSYVVEKESAIHSLGLLEAVPDLRISYISYSLGPHIMPGPQIFKK